MFELLGFAYVLGFSDSPNLLCFKMFRFPTFIKIPPSQNIFLWKPCEKAIVLDPPEFEKEKTKRDFQMFAVRMLHFLKVWFVEMLGYENNIFEICVHLFLYLLKYVCIKKEVERSIFDRCLESSKNDPTMILNYPLWINENPQNTIKNKKQQIA